MVEDQELLHETRRSFPLSSRGRVVEPSCCSHLSTVFAHAIVICASALGFAPRPEHRRALTDPTKTSDADPPDQAVPSPAWGAGPAPRITAWLLQQGTKQVPESPFFQTSRLLRVRPASYPSTRASNRYRRDWSPTLSAQWSRGRVHTKRWRPVGGAS